MKENTASDTQIQDIETKNAQIQDIETWGLQPRNVESHNGKADNSEGKGIAVNDGGGDDDRADSGNDSRDNGRSAGRNKRLHRGAAPELKGMLRFCRGVYLKIHSDLPRIYCASCSLRLAGLYLWLRMNGEWQQVSSRGW